MPKDLNDTDIRSTLDFEGSVEAYEEIKVPWWGYIWASILTAQGWTSSLTSDRIMSQAEAMLSGLLSRN